MTAIDDLVLTLLEGTKAGSVQWEQADSRGRALIARRSSGTVVIEGPATVASTLVDPQVTKLSVKNAEGRTVEEVEAIPPEPFTIPATLGPAFDPPAIRNLPALWWAAREQVTQATTVVRSLTSEFKQTPD